MKLSVEKSFYSFLESNMQSSGKCEELEEIIEELSEVSFGGSSLKGYYGSEFGSVYNKNRGFVSYTKDMVFLLKRGLDVYDFNFSFDEALRVFIFSNLRPFMKKRMKKYDNFESDYIEDEYLVAFYLQKNNVSLSDKEYCGIFKKDSKIHRVLDALQTVSYSSKERLNFDNECNECNEELKGDVNKENDNNSEKTDEDEGKKEESVDDSEVLEDEEVASNQEEDEAAASFEELFEN